MRKDVRMGFAVGGVLLAVLVVAILFLHRNKNAGQAVAFDSGGKPAVASGNEQPAPDATQTPDNAQPATAAPAPTPTPAPANNTPAEPKTPADDPGQKSGTRWDQLFASTAEDPIKAQLQSETLGKPKNKSRKHNSDAPAVSDLGEKHDSASAAMPAVANTPLNTSSSSTFGVAAPRSVSSSRLTSQAPKESGRTHVVAQGETFVSIARAVYGDGRYYQSLIDANPSIDPDKLKPGMTIQLPPDSQVKQSRSKSAKSSGSASSPSLTSDGKTYTVQNGDSLYKIAKKLYGNGQKSDDLYEANKQTIGPDSTRLRVGMVLTLPEAPTVR